MNKQDLERLADMRLREAEVLLKAGFYSGAYYLEGYAIECLLKAYATKQIKQYDFPDRKFINGLYTHDLEELLKSSGLKQDLDNDIKSNPNLETKWLIIKDWRETSRYDCEGKTEAQELYDAIADHNHGIATWIKSKL